MKKRLLALILSALFLINAVACNTVHAPENGEGTIEDTDTNTEAEIKSEKNTEEATQDSTETTSEESSFDDAGITVEVSGSISEGVAPVIINTYPLHGSFVNGGAYIQEDEPILLTEVNGQRYFYVKQWNRAYPTTSEYSMTYVGQCGTEEDNVAWIFIYEREESYPTDSETATFKMIKLHRETERQEISILSLPIALRDGISGIRCSMLDSNTGFLFIYGWLDDSNACLSALVKTTDGGKTWSVIERGERKWPTSSWRDKFIVSHFFDENKGIIVPRTAAGANVNPIYITLDGGQTWSAATANIPFHDYDSELIGAYYYYLELANFECVNEKYILTFRLNDGSGGERDGEIVLFSSSDLVSWIYVHAPENEGDETIEDTTSPESTAEDPEETNTETSSTTWEGTITCNGVYRNSKVKFAINQNKQLILYIEDWNESFVVPNEDMYFVFETVHSSSVVLGESKGALIFSDFSLPAKPIKVIRFTKGNPQVTIENLTLEPDDSHRDKFCNFINEQTGYLFLFIQGKSNAKLTKMLKTTNDGETWIEQPVEVPPSSIWDREDIICAKMVDENVGLIAGGFHAEERSLSRRTYITTDGGLTWSSIHIQYPKNLDGLGGEEACDILYEDGQYILICKFREDGSDIWVKYTSTDLKTWTEIQ